MWLPQAWLQTRPKISFHCLPSKEGEAKEQEGKKPTDKHQSLLHAQPSTSNRVALQVGAQCSHLSGLCLLRLHLPMGVLIWPVRLGKAAPAPIAASFCSWPSDSARVDSLRTIGGPSPQRPCPAALGEPPPYWGKCSFISRSDPYSLGKVIFVQEALKYQTKHMLRVFRLLSCQSWWKKNFFQLLKWFSTLSARH